MVYSNFVFDFINSSIIFSIHLMQFTILKSPVVLNYMLVIGNGGKTVWLIIQLSLSPEHLQFMSEATIYVCIRTYVLHRRCTFRSIYRNIYRVTPPCHLPFQWVVSFEYEVILIQVRRTHWLNHCQIIHGNW